MAYNTNGKSIKQITEAIAQGICTQAQAIATFTERMNREDKGEGYKARNARAIEALTQGVADPVKFAFTDPNALPKATPTAKPKAKAKAPANPLSGLSQAQMAQVMAFVKIIAKS